MDDFRSLLAKRMDPGMVIGGKAVFAPNKYRVTNSFAGEHVGTISIGGPEHVESAVSAAQLAFEGGLPAHARYDLLMRVADMIDAEADSYALDLAREGHKTIREARREPGRAANVFRLAAEEGRRIVGETLPFDIKPGSEKRVGYYFRVPLGVVAAILPFNDPLAVVAHKIGPAIAAGNACVVKPDSRSALAVLRLAHQFIEAGAPPGMVNCVTGSGADVGTALVEDSRVRMVSFTGGQKTGELIAARIGIRRMALELGSNSAAIVMQDAILDSAVESICSGAFAQAGQNCLGVQRVMIHEQQYDSFASQFVEAVRRLSVGSSLSEVSDVCPVINEQEAVRIEGLIDDATTKGAQILIGGKRDGAVIEPTVIANLPKNALLYSDEAYGPVVSLYKVSSLDEAIKLVNGVPLGLHAAIFTESIQSAFDAARRLKVGGVIVNDSTDYRLDTMPFGGSRNSGVGREGVRFAIEEMTETRVVCFNLR